MKVYLLLILLLGSLYGNGFPRDVSGQILYWSHHGMSEKAFSYYMRYCEENKVHDFELLQEACVRLLEQGMQARDPETQLMCMFGAGMATSPRMIPLLQKGLKCPEPKIQLVALRFLSKLNDDEADFILKELLLSPLLIMRLEAAFALAKKQDPEILEHLHSLYYLVPKEARVVFPEIVAIMETPHATKFLEKLLADSYALARLAAIVEAGQSQREDLIFTLRQIATRPTPAEQEASIHALALLKDEASLPLFWEGTKKRDATHRLVCWQALDALGEESAREKLIEEAHTKNLFAITLLGESKGDEKAVAALKMLLASEDELVTFNAALSLLKLGHTPPAAFLERIFFKSHKDLGFAANFSPGRALKYWTVVPNASSLKKTHAGLEEESAIFREKMLRLTIELPESDFLTIARAIFERNQVELVAPLCSLLMNKRSEGALELLKQMQQKAGAPLIRSYCNLALYHLGEEGPYEQTLLAWVKDGKNHPLIQFKEETKKELVSQYDLTAQESSQLLISSFEELASKQHELGINALIHAIAYGNEKNKYALAGLLIRSLE